MVKLRKLLLENPDSIVYRGILQGFTDAKSMFVMYDDIKDNTIHYVDFDYDTKKIISDSDAVVKELQSLPDVSHNYYATDRRLEFLHIGFRFWDDKYITHGQMIVALEYLNRSNSDDRRDDTTGREKMCLGRLFIDDAGEYPILIVTFWNSKQHVQKYKEYIKKYLSHKNIDSSLPVMYQAARTHKNSEFEDYDTFFGTDETPNPLQAELAKLAEKLHVDKAKLDKAVLNVIRSNPESLNDIYAEFEKMFNKPYVAIRHLLGNLPLYIFRASKK